MMKRTGKSCQVVNITSNYSNPEFRFDFYGKDDLTVSYFVLLVGLFGSPVPENYDRSIIDQIHNGDIIEILNLDYGPESSQNYRYTDPMDPTHTLYHRRYFIAEAINSNYVHNTLRELEFRIITDEKIVFYLHFWE